MKRTVAEQLIADHLVEGDLEPGSEIGLRIDQTLTQDATGTLVMLELEAMQVDRVSHPGSGTTNTLACPLFYFSVTGPCTMHRFVRISRRGDRARRDEGARWAVPQRRNGRSRRRLSRAPSRRGPTPRRGR